ncbi:ligand-binding sensor domain-containing diguanylate cyclase [Pseudomarimonas arenosa]|uniref:ligand-binding sensor domain-containing diguanylate cyclase n=1 Tax=Pseudomarimonas arenosa TaxID=2774145 RepID=UPI00178592F7|nr:diguanylate cyclase [Pseudomarimonas arenosa]
MLLLFAGSPIAAATRPLDVADQGAPVFQVFGAKEGLSDEIWSAVGFDQQGFVWAGSASGLARFDGYRFTPYEWPEARSLVRDMAHDADGLLWAIFEREGLASYRDGQWRLSGNRSFSQRFSPIDPLGEARQLFVAQADLNMRVEQGVWVPAEPGSSSLPGDQIKLTRTSTLYGEARWWSGRSDGSLWFQRVDGEPLWQAFDLSAYSTSQITDLLRTEHRGREELWILTYGGGLLRLRDDGVRVWRAARGELPSEAIYSAVATHDAEGERTLWLASRGGLIRLQAEQTRAFDRRHGLPSNAIRGIKARRSIDGEDTLWLATEGGLARARISASPWQIVSLIGASENGVFGLLLEPDDHGGERLWVGSAKEGLAMLHEGQWQYFSAARGNFPDAAVRGIWRMEGLDGEPLRLIGLVDRDPLRIEGAASFSRFETPWPKQNGNALTSVLSRTVAGERELWMGTLRSGVYRQDQSGWHKLELSQQPRAWAAFSLTEQIDSSGRSWIWLATDLGLARFDGERLQLLHALPDLPKGGFRSITLMPDQHGRAELWASSHRNGVVRLDVSSPDRPRVLTDDRLPAAPDPTVYSVLRDSQGRIYVCTNNGVQKLVRDANGGYRQTVFRRRDGLVHDECNSNGQLIDAHDRYWVGTLAGLSLYDPALQPEAETLQPKPLILTRLLVDGLEQLTRRSELLIPAGSRDLRFEFVLLSDQRESETRYRSRLLPDDPAFGDWSSLPGRSFGRLAPGDYLLEIEAMDYGQTLGQPLSIAFRVAPQWWEQRWVQASGLLALVCLAAIFGLAYHRQLRRRQRELLQLIQDRTAELNQANARLTELSYLDPLTQLANRRRLMEALEKALQYGRSEQKSIGLILIDIDHFKDYNDHHGHLAGDTALRAVAQALNSAKRARDLVARYGGEEFVCLLEDSDAQLVDQVARRMHQRVAELSPRSLGNNQHGASISLGFVCRIPRPGDRAETLLQDADLALYEAKHRGRNQIVAHHDLSISASS